MIWKILAVGRPSLPYARDGVNEYLNRLGAMVRIEAEFIKDSPDAEETMIARSAKHFRIALDETGKEFTSTGFANFLRELDGRATSRCALLVAGADGWKGRVPEGADLVWSLGRQTLQHELALLVAMEQIYRAHAIIRGLPYHREGARQTRPK